MIAAIFWCASAVFSRKKRDSFGKTYSALILPTQSSIPKTILLFILSSRKQFALFTMSHSLFSMSHSISGRFRGFSPFGIIQSRIYILHNSPKKKNCLATAIRSKPCPLLFVVVLVGLVCLLIWFCGCFRFVIFLSCWFDFCG